MTLEERAEALQGLWGGTPKMYEETLATLRAAEASALKRAAGVADAVQVEGLAIASNNDASESDRTAYRCAASGAEEVAAKIRALTTETTSGESSDEERRRQTESGLHAVAAERQRELDRERETTSGEG